MARDILELLLKEGLLTKLQSEQVLLEQRKTGKALMEVITSLGFVNEEQISRSLARQIGVPFVDLDYFVIERNALELIKEETARRYRMVPLYLLGSTLAVAMADPFNIYAVDELTQKHQVEVLVTVATGSAIKRAINEYYRVTDSVRDVIPVSYTHLTLPTN